MTEHEHETSHRHQVPVETPYNPQLRADTEGMLPTVHQAMARAMELVTAVGKTGENREQGYKFRSIDKFMDALNPAMSQAGVHVVPRVLQRLVGERTTKNGARMRLVDLEVAFTFYGPAGDSVVAISWGEGTDTGDKATNKAMTGAFKYAIVQVFMVPTSDIQDSDQHSPDVPTQGESAAADNAQADASPEVVAELRARALDISQRPKGERAKALAALWKDAQRARALGATASVPEGWRALVGKDELTLHELVTGVRETDQLPPHGEGLAAGEQADTATGEVGPAEQAPAPLPEDETPPGRCPKLLQGKAQCTLYEGHSGRHSYESAPGTDKAKAMEETLCREPDAAGWPCNRAPGHDGEHSADGEPERHAGVGRA